MFSQMLRTRWLWLVPAAFLGACDSVEEEQPVEQYELRSPEVLVSMESGILAEPWDMDRGSEGELYVLDRLDQRVVRISPEGTVEATIGGPGEGPGEFEGVMALGVDADDRLRVYDFRNGSVEVFEPSGTHTTTYSTDLTGLPSRIAFGPNGFLAYAGTRPTQQGALVALLDTLGRQVSLLGDLVSSETGIPSTLLEELHQREMPELMRNNVLPVLGEEHVWLILQTEGVIQRFASDGTLDVETPITIPEMEAIRREFFDWYAEIDAPNMLRYFEYVEAAVKSGDFLWLLWSMPESEPRLVTVHDLDGELSHRFILQGLQTESSPEDPSERPPRRRMAVDLEIGRIYLVDQKALTVLAFQIPDEVDLR